MALDSAVQGANRPSQTVTWLRSDGDPQDLTSADMTGFIRNKKTGDTRPIGGTVTVTSGTAGVFVWTYGTADLVSAGDFEVQFVATFSQDPTTAKSIIADWTVERALG